MFFHFYLIFNLECLLEVAKRHNLKPHQLGNYSYNSTSSRE